MEMKNTLLHPSLLRFAVFAASAALGAACSPKEGPRAKHDGEIAVSAKVTSPKGGKADPKALATIDVNELKTQAQGGRSLTVLSQLEPYMLFATYIENPHYAT